MHSEKQLLQRAKDFDLEALEEIFNRYNDGLYRYAYRLLGDASMAEECVSETFNRLLQAFHNDKGPDKYLRAYLYRIAHNWIAAYYKKHTQPDLNLELVLDHLSEADDNTASIAEINMQREWIRKAIIDLPVPQQTAIVLKYFEGWSNKEIAAIMKKTVGAVKALENRGISNLKKKIQIESVRRDRHGSR
ncbi:MAG: sigma-70 family RNA polymerase sigma factor [Chloroflexi bacterium]|nr:MAG: sigma-70 family RNA polymerase sigma factor [Chloroflexota bacterium]MBL1194367.1 sigma-70 family RNA polymerase sigma factor [Chloroflexota bacterium]NOH11655.1 sigma-70 family RNA polymerase sigma factor [Chloroflexota bacterium]